MRRDAVFRAAGGAAVVAVLVFAGVARAQAVHLAGGEVLAGRVTGVTGSRVEVQLADGSLRQLEVHAVDHERTAEGAVRRFPAQHLPGAHLEAAAAAVLARLGAGKAIDAIELQRLTSNAPLALVDELRTVATTGKSAAARTGAMRALAAIGSEASVRAALDAANADASGAAWRALAPALSSSPCLGAIAALAAVADVERGLASKDRAVRGACAWVATKLGSEAAIPVLATFVGDPDHHVREAAAVALAEAGDAAGAKVLITMCKRERAPVVDANRGADAATRELVARLAHRERVDACRLLGRLRCAAAAPVLRALAGHADRELAAAAAAALARLEEPPAAGTSTPDGGGR